MFDGLMDWLTVGVQFLVQHVKGSFWDGFTSGFVSGIPKGLFLVVSLLLINLLFKNMQTIRMLLLMGMFTFFLSMSIDYKFYQANPQLIPLLIFGGIFMFWSLFGGKN